MKSDALIPSASYGLSRLGRSTKDLIELTELFQSKGVHLVSLKESIDTSTSTGKLLFTLMSAIAQFERDVIADRTNEGLKSARARGRTPLDWNNSVSSIKSLVLRPSLDRDSITTVSPSVIRSSILANSGRSRLVPVIFSL